MDVANLYMDLENLYMDLENLYMDLENPYMDVEDTYMDLPKFLAFQISYQFFKTQFLDFGVLFLLLQGRETLASTKLDSSRRVIYDSFWEIIL